MLPIDIKMVPIPTYRNFIIIVLIYFLKPLGAQNYLYNSEQFGIKGSMLGGVVTAGVDDISMIYYNPAAMDQVADGISISLVQPKITTFGFKQFWEETEDRRGNMDVGLKPSLISFKAKFKNFNLAFIKIGKSDFNDQFFAKRETTNNNLKSVSNFEYNYEGSDNWYGIGTSFEVKPNFFLGVSQFVSVSSFSYRNEILVKGEDPNPNINEPILYTRSSLRNTFNNLGLVSKVGFLYDREIHDFGLTITTPTFSRFNKGGYFNLSRVNFDSSNTSNREIVDSELNPIIKTPWEFNFGYSFVYKSNHKFWLNAIYYTEISDYVMTEIETLDDKVKWENGNRSVLNYGIGYSNKVSTNLELSVGMRTNFFGYENKVVDEDKIRNAILDGNHLHFTFSTQYKYKRNSILLGIDWGTLISNPEEENFIILSEIRELAPNAESLTKNSFNILFTYGFLIEELKK